ncbi:MAG: hypothetical protein GJU76_04185 [Gallionella sp.]|jgi:hypothetical protein|nr:hypothetical protein [Gallionella sp.]
MKDSPSSNESPYSVVNGKLMRSTATSRIEMTPSDAAKILNAMDAKYAELLALAKRYASECSGCDGEGRRIVTFNDREAEYDPCEDCADIRAVIAKAEEA